MFSYGENVIFNVISMVPQILGNNIESIETYRTELKRIICDSDQYTVLSFSILFPQKTLCVEEIKMNL